MVIRFDEIPWGQAWFIVDGYITVEDELISSST